MIAELLTDRGLAMLLAGFAAFAAIVALGLPPEADPRVQARMRMVARERDRLRERRLSELSAPSKRKVRLEQAGPIARLLGRLRPEAAKSAGDLTARLRMAGLRGQGPEAVFLFFRATTPVLFFAAALAAALLRPGSQTPPGTALLIAMAAAVIGFVAPRFVLDKLIARRQASITRAFPDALDLLLICVQSGLSVEAALSKVARDISCQSIELAEELSLTMAELSYLPVRWKAYAESGRAHRHSHRQADHGGADAGGAIRHLRRPGPDRRRARGPRGAHRGGRTPGRLAAAETGHSAGRVLPAGATGHHFNAGADAGKPGAEGAWRQLYRPIGQS